MCVHETMNSFMCPQYVEILLLSLSNFPAKETIKLERDGSMNMYGCVYERIEYAIW